MVKALRGEAVVLLSRVSNNTDHECLRLARRVKTFSFLLAPVPSNGILRKIIRLYFKVSHVCLFFQPFAEKIS